MEQFDSGACESALKDELENESNSPDMNMDSNDQSHCNTSTFSFEKPFLAMNYKEYFDEKKCCTKGCKWAPDGSCLLVASDNRELNIFNLPPNIAYGQFHDEDWITKGWRKDLCPVLQITENGDLYDYCWYPPMKSSDPTTCCFAVTCRQLPIHLWDAWTGQLICSYSAYDHLDQMISAFSVAFSDNGINLVSGYKKATRVYDITRPGRQCTVIACDKQCGIMSCLSFHPELQHIYAAGSYEGSVTLFSINYKKPFAVLQGHLHGVTHVQFSSDGTKLFSGTRRDDEILCWDIRQPGKMLASLKREVTTNQRMYFDLTPEGNKFLLSGTTDGKVLVWELEDYLSSVSSDNPPEILPSLSFSAHNDCVNGINVHPFYPILATSSGQRHAIEQPKQEDSSDSDNHDLSPQEIGVKIWWLGQMSC